MAKENNYYKRMDNNEITYPKTVFPFEYHKIKLFTSEFDGEWNVTEVKTGFRIGGYAKSKEKAEEQVKSVIDQKGINLVKNAIKDALRNIKEGKSYDAKRQEWVQHL